MIRIVALHKMPENPEQYEKYYREVHTPIVQRIPGVQNIRFGRVVGMEDKSTSPYLLVSDTYFNDMESLRKALASDEMAEALADVQKFSSAGDVTIMFCEAEDVPPMPTSR
ncbi:MAG: hypothetical protein NVS4B2_11360 [Chloroflexota bacterium]